LTPIDAMIVALQLRFARQRPKPISFPRAQEKLKLSHHSNTKDRAAPPIAELNGVPPELFEF
jgi:hypothetical protein